MKRWPLTPRSLLWEKRYCRVHLWILGAYGLDHDSILPVIFLCFKLLPKYFVVIIYHKTKISSPIFIIISKVQPIIVLSMLTCKELCEQSLSLVWAMIKIRNLFTKFRNLTGFRKYLVCQQCSYFFLFFFVLCLLNLSSYLLTFLVLPYRSVNIKVHIR